MVTRCKILGGKRDVLWQCENDRLSLSIKTDYEVEHFFGIYRGIFFLPATFFVTQGYLSSALAARTCKCICFEFELTGCFYIFAYGIRSIFVWDEMKIGLCKKDCRIKQHFTLESDNFDSRDRISRQIACKKKRIWNVQISELKYNVNLQWWLQKCKKLQNKYRVENQGG